MTTHLSRRCETSSALSAMIALCLLGDKELLGGNCVRTVTRPAPQRQLERSQAAELAFRSLDRRLDEFFGNRTPICKHDAPPIPIFPVIIVNDKSDNFGTPSVPG
jgi:hypothetical protein